ncbi:fibronectin type III domain-containing protein [Paenibacillus sp. HWE-109]|uniref:fibronectin type III domain-containing protein n=1 Tax=Paenibacillus sp. HWE-109 TaxID=1306526 RepID=UPI001EDCE587|nr:fibronectin type III domain-containing protein [Paenibacillus sp. HWE-109]UKS28078.1 fibronectin type III domain-containing protein [Paenibacillus sp. HWE-109]
MRKYKLKLASSFLILSLVFVQMFSVIAAAQSTPNIIPVMTSSTSPSGIITQSSAYDWPRYQPYNAFDGKTEVNADWGTTEFQNAWLAYEFPTKKTVTSYAIACGQSTALCPESWRFEAYDGTSWVTLDSKSGYKGSYWVEKLYQLQTFSITNTDQYIKYRIFIVQNTGGNNNTVNIDLNEFQMYETSIQTPASPINLTAVGGDTKVDLNWSVTSGASSYNVKRSTIAGGPYTTIATNVTGTSYTDTSVTNGTTYYYVITAVNSSGESGNSNETSATPQAPAQSGRAILVITLLNGVEKEYDLSKTEVDVFINWYNARATGTGSITYAIDKHNNNKGPFKARKDYILFDKILTFEVNEYDSN